MEAFRNASQRNCRVAAAVAAALMYGVIVRAQEPTSETRAGSIASEQAEKSRDLQPATSSRAEQIVDRLERRLVGGELRFHPWFESAYAGGGFTLGAGWGHYVSSYNTIDLRGSYTVLGYKRIEAEFRMPRLFDRRGTLSVLGG